MNTLFLFGPRATIYNTKQIKYYYFKEMMVIMYGKYLVVKEKIMKILLMH